VPRRPVEAGVQQPNVYRALDGRPEAGEQAFGRMGLGKADPVDGNGNVAALALHRDYGGGPPKMVTESGKVSSLVIRDSAS